jgi:hypothetical protein
MKNFIDRIDFIYHRPRFFNKTFTAIGVQFIPFGKQVKKYLESADLKLYDYKYYQEQGWFKSDYYYDIHLNLIQKALGRFSDYLGRQLFK